MERQMAIEAPAQPVSTPRAKKEPRRMEQLFNLFAFVVFLMLWVAFAYGLAANQGGLDAVWQWARTLWLPLQLVVGLLFLPVAIGLWVWETGWPVLIRLPLLVALGAWNLWMFLPKTLFGR
jgi:hypothetical protein